METADDPTCPVKREIVSIESKRDWRLFNIVLLGIAFMLMFTAFQTCGMVEVGRLSTGVAHNQWDEKTRMASVISVPHKSCARLLLLGLLE